MAIALRINRRVTGSPGAPSSLLNGELAYNEVDNILYYGKGLASGVTAAVVIAIGGSGVLSGYSSLTAAQTISGNNTFTGVVLVPTVAGADNSTKAANTEWVRDYSQPLATSLTSISNLASLGLIAQTSAGVYAARNIAGTAGRTVVTDGDAASGNPTIDLATVTDSGVGSLQRVTVDTYGRVTGTQAPTQADIVTALGFTPEDTANKGLANGYASLDSGGKVPVSQLPSAVTGGNQFIGVWNASTNTPALVGSTGTTGYFYIVSVAGNTALDGYDNWSIGDQAIFVNGVWNKIEGGNPDVSSVAGRKGAVVLTDADISGLGTMATQDASAVVITGGTIPASTLTGILSVDNGGTGAATLTGYVKGSGAVALTASATIPNTDITGLGTMAVQNASAVAITGGTIDGIILDGGDF